ncbi:MAG: ATP-binding protein [Bacteroidales bacterium]|jgi:hypothetical protein|nr:ATP-binding protein [Bacteroidales bacterium]
MNVRELYNIIKYESEGSNLDYKQQEYPLGKHNKKNEILKDISAFANHPSDEDKYIIVGVVEENGMAKSFYELEKLTDEASYQQFVLENIEPKVNFEYKSFEYEGNKLAYFRIFNNRSRPYLFRKDTNGSANAQVFKKGDGFIRAGSTTRKLDRSDFESIYRNRYTKIDRKDDIEINTYLRYSDNSKLIGFKGYIRYFDIEIINKSNKSISFDVELKVYKDSDFELFREDDLIEVLRDRNNLVIADLITNGEYIYDGVSFSDMLSFTMLNKSNINVSQDSSISDVFNRNLYVLADEECEVNAEIVIRSDDFTEGPLVKKLLFS